ncbi:MAG: hypothetical protein H0W76_21965 [Pyrinomonadaceae bacterium]|nr:hypothetical protein [Pyrinomonadaceae bacterium]
MRTNSRKLYAALLLPLTALAGFAAGRQTAPMLTVKLDNTRVAVTESLTPAGGRRAPYTRPTDQVLVFLDDAEYESVDDAGKATARRRKNGDIVWHTKGESAPLLVNKGKPYRNLIIALK